LERFQINPGCLTEQIEMGINNFVFGGLPDRKACDLINELSYNLISISQ